MAIVTARMFNQSPSTVKAMAKHEPVFVTERGVTTVVVMDVEEYDRLNGAGSVRQSLLMPDGDDIQFEPVISRSLPQAADL